MCHDLTRSLGRVTFKANLQILYIYELRCRHHERVSQKAGITRQSVIGNCPRLRLVRASARRVRRARIKSGFRSTRTRQGLPLRTFFTCLSEISSDYGAEACKLQVKQEIRIFIRYMDLSEGAAAAVAGLTSQYCI